MAGDRKIVYAVDPAAYELIDFIKSSRVDRSAMPLWEKQFLSDYLLPTNDKSIAARSSTVREATAARAEQPQLYPSEPPQKG